MGYHLEVATLAGTTLGPVLVAASPVALPFLGQHDDSGALLFPDHPPEVLCGVWQWTLCRNEGFSMVVALK